MLSQGSVVQGRNVVTEIGCTGEECCHRDQLYRGGMLPKRLVAQEKNVVTGISCTGTNSTRENADTAWEQQSKGAMLIQRDKQHKNECCHRD
jgi:hypothetical protein